MRRTIWCQCGTMLGAVFLAATPLGADELVPRAKPGENPTPPITATVTSVTPQEIRTKEGAVYKPETIERIEFDKGMQYGFEFALVLNDGSELPGVFLGRKKGQFQVKMPGFGTVSYPAKDVAGMRFMDDVTSDEMMQDYNGPGATLKDGMKISGRVVSTDSKMVAVNTTTGLEKRLIVALRYVTFREISPPSQGAELLLRNGMVLNGNFRLAGASVFVRVGSDAKETEIPLDSVKEISYRYTKTEQEENTK